MNYQTADHLDDHTHKSLGADYTPQDIAIRMAQKFDLKETDKTADEWKEFKVLDPTVGKGNLLLAMKEVYPWLTNDNLYGVDVDPEAIFYCITEFSGGHFKVGNILNDPVNDSDFWAQDQTEILKQVTTKKQLETDLGKENADVDEIQQKIDAIKNDWKKFLVVNKGSEPKPKVVKGFGFFK